MASNHLVNISSALKRSAFTAHHRRRQVKFTSQSDQIASCIGGLPPRLHYTPMGGILQYGDGLHAALHATLRYSTAQHSTEVMHAKRT
mmetsp:Transcript_58981/g.144289  ORF Transcript_58981/g.144289 Transcript_58981/m.144289 type:complete len:88 (-) Transcript_58981:523-786(-)